MIGLDTFSTVLTTPGPYATAYLDATRSKELGPQEVDKRWRAVRAALAEQGADEPTLAAMDAAVGGHTDVPGPHGQVLVAAGGVVHQDLALPEPPRQDGGSWAPLPHLMPAVAQLGARVPYVLALVDRTGADVTVVGPDRSSTEERTVEGETYHARKLGIGGWAHLRYQHRAEDVWEANARQVAGLIETAVHTRGVRAVVLAGDVRAREALRKNLDERSADLVTELQTGGRADGIDAEKLDAEVDAVVARAALDADQAVLDRFAEAYGRATSGISDVLAGAGIPDTVAALRQAQVETLLLVDDPSSTATAWIGPEPTHLALTADELTGLGVTEPVQVRLDAALLRAVAGTDATVVTLAPGQLDVPDGLGATYRYPTAP
jgi:hypothetical protein